MIISKIQLDPRKRDTAKALQNRGLFHSAMEDSVGGERPHILWRLEPNMSILAVSKDIPFLGDIQNRFGDSFSKPVSKPYDAYLDSIADGDLMKFTITVNPVINVSNGSKNGKDVPLNLRRTPKYPFCAEDWMIKKLEERGVEVREIRDIAHETVYFIKRNRRIPIFMVTYSGVFHVRESKELKDAMITGIGGKKTYGCGLLSAVRIRGI